MIKSIGLIFLFLYSNMVADKNTIRLKISNLKNNKGHVAILVFNQPNGFPGNIKQACKLIYVTPKNNMAQAEIKDLPAGNYAISVLHDENDNKAMDKNFIGIPTEGFGVSNNPKTRFGPPDFSDAVFKLTHPNLSIEISMNYF